MWKATCIAAVTALAAASAQAGIVVSETFDTDGTIGDYSGSGKLFTDNAVVAPASGTASGGEFNMTFSDNTATGSMYAHISMGGTKTLVSMSFDFTGVSYGAATDGWSIFFGQFANLAAFNPSWHIYADRTWANVHVASTTGGNYDVKAYDNAGTAYTLSQTAGTSSKWSFFLNQSGSTQSFTGPDSVSHNLDDGRWSLFLGTTLVADNITKGTIGASGSLDSVILKMNRNYNGGTSNTILDNIVIRDDLDLFIPEPASLALLGLGGLAMLRRRK